MTVILATPLGLLVSLLAVILNRGRRAGLIGLAMIGALALLPHVVSAVRHVFGLD